MRDTKRVAIVTGAARGIGAAIATRLSTDGHDVAVLDIDTDACAKTVRAVRANGGRGLAIAADVADEAEVAAAVELIAAELGAPTILVNNAGITRDNLLFKMTTNDWDEVIDVNLRGPFLLSRAVQRHMVEAQFGRIVNISSTSALGNRGQANYAAAKSGLQGFTKSLALELGKFGITTNAIAPGFIVSEMTIATAARMGISFEEFAQINLEMIPVGRLGQPQDVAHLASFLASEGAGFVNGQVVYIAGGPRA